MHVPRVSAPTALGDHPVPFSDASDAGKKEGSMWLLEFGIWNSEFVIWDLEFEFWNHCRQFITARHYKSRKTYAPGFFAGCAFHDPLTGR